MQTAAMFANLPIGSVVYGSMLAPPNMPPGMHLIGGELTATPLSPGCLMRYVKTSSGWSAGEMITQQMLQEELASQKEPQSWCCQCGGREAKQRGRNKQMQQGCKMWRKCWDFQLLQTTARSAAWRPKKVKRWCKAACFTEFLQLAKHKKIQDDISDAATTTASVKSDDAVDVTFYSFWSILSVEFSKPICMNGFHFMRISLCKGVQRDFYIQSVCAEVCQTDASKEMGLLCKGAMNGFHFMRVTLCKGAQRDFSIAFFMQSVAQKWQTDATQKWAPCTVHEWLAFCKGA